MPMHHGFLTDEKEKRAGTEACMYAHVEMINMINQMQKWIVRIELNRS